MIDTAPQLSAGLALVQGEPASAQRARLHGQKPVDCDRARFHTWWKKLVEYGAWASGNAVDHRLAADAELLGRHGFRSLTAAHSRTWCTCSSVSAGLRPV